MALLIRKSLITYLKIKPINASIGKRKYILDKGCLLEYSKRFLKIKQV
jgi:hypothetical protein